MTEMNTKYLTMVFDKLPLIDPSTIDNILGERKKKHERKDYYYKQKELNPSIYFVVDIASQFLDLHNITHNNNIWYMDCIRYTLENEKKGINSGLAWHCENDNYPNLISILFYLTVDENIIDGNLRYKDKDNNKNIIKIKSGMTIIMDGRVVHKPQNPYGTGKRDLIIVSFEL